MSALNICCSCFSWTEWPDIDSHDPFRVSVVNVSEGDQLMRARFAKAAAGNGAVSGEIFLNTAVKFKNCIKCFNVCQDGTFCSQLGMVKYCHEFSVNSKGHAKRLLFFFWGTRSPLRFIYSNVTVSAISFLICQSIHTLLIVLHCKSECFMKQLDCCGQGQGHSLRLH